MKKKLVKGLYGFKFERKKKLCVVRKWGTHVVYAEKLLREWITGQDMKCNTVDVYNK